MSVATVESVLAELEALGTERLREQNMRHGAGENQFGVMMGDIRKVAKAAKKDHERALALWATGNSEARRVAILTLTPKLLSEDEIDAMVRSVIWPDVLDWFCRYVINKHPAKAALRERWMADPHPMAGRAGWALAGEDVVKAPDHLDLGGLLDLIDAQMPGAPPETQWTMNTTLAQIGIAHAEHRARALAIGESHGLYREWPEVKGCTSPYAPIWINEMVSRADR